MARTAPRLVMPLLATVFLFFFFVVRVEPHPAHLLVYCGYWIYFTGYFTYRALAEDRVFLPWAVMFAIVSVFAIVRALSAYHLFRPDRWPQGPTRARILLGGPGGPQAA